MTGVVAVLHDVSRLRQLEEVRRQFVANVSHELRTPLSIFQGYLETLLETPGLSPEEVANCLRDHEPSIPAGSRRCWMICSSSPGWNPARMRSTWSRWN